jgi:hypothetical protein
MHFICLSLGFYLEMLEREKLTKPPCFIATIPNIYVIEGHVSKDGGLNG